MATSCSTRSSEIFSSSATVRSAAPSCAVSWPSSPDDGSSSSTIDGPVREGARHFDSPGRSQRQHRRADVGDAAQVEQVDQVVDPGSLGGGRPVERARGEEVAPQPAALVADPVAEDHVLADREAHEQLELLEGPGEPEARALRRRRAGDLASTEEDVAGLGSEQPREHVEQRGLAGAVRSDEPDDAGGRDHEAHVADRDEPAEAHGDVAGLDRRRDVGAGRTGGGGGVDGAHDGVTSAVWSSGSADGGGGGGRRQPRIVAAGEAGRRGHRADAAAGAVDVPLDPPGERVHHALGVLRQPDRTEAEAQGRQERPVPLSWRTVCR